MRVPALALLIVLVSASIGIAAQQQAASQAPQAAQRDPQAVAVLAQVLKASGGAAITDITLTGAAERIAGADDEAGTATLKATAAGDSRLDLSFSSGPESEIRNHASMSPSASMPSSIPAATAQALLRTGAWSGPDGASHSIASHNLMTESSWFFPALLLARLSASQQYAISYADTESKVDRPVIHLTVVQQFPGLPARSAALMQHLSEMDIFFDQTTLLPLVLAFSIHPDDNACSIFRLRFTSRTIAL